MQGTIRLFQCPEGLGGDCYVRVVEPIDDTSFRVSMPRRAWGGLLQSSSSRPIVDSLIQGFNAPKGLGGIATQVSHCAASVHHIVSMPRRAWGGLLQAEIRIHGLRA